MSDFVWWIDKIDPKAKVEILDKLNKILQDEIDHEVIAKIHKEAKE